MINSSDVNDLQLEDVEDYSADYPPAGFPQAETNIAAMGMPTDKYTPKKRTSQLMHLLRSNKKVTCLVLAIIVIVITIIAVAGGNKEESSSSMARGSNHPILVDPESLDPAITGPLMEKLLGVYTRKGMDASVLDREAGDTAQRKAFYWMATDQMLASLHHTQLMQRYALAVFYYATNNVKNVRTDAPKPWVSAHLWLSDAHACEWKGIVCNEQQHVESIDLERNNLTGSLPLELELIAGTLKTLDLTSNLIYMEGVMYDVFETLTSLETLLMDDNYLSYDNGLPPQFEKLENLKKMRLSYNLFAGQLEGEHKVLAKMNKLTHLEIESNFLSGSLPPVIGELTNLVYLYMRRNELNFNLDFLKGGTMTDMFALWLDGNDITGTIPTELGLLTELASVSMTNATLTGTIPTEIGELTGLRRLWLYNNQLTGAIPPALRRLTDLEVLELHHNKLGGAMPLSLCAAIDSSEYKFKSLTSDCQQNQVECDTNKCCTECY